MTGLVRPSHKNSILVSEGDLNAAVSGDNAYQGVPILAGQRWFSSEPRTSPYPSEPPCFIASADKVMTRRGVSDVGAGHYGRHGDLPGWIAP